MKSKITAFIFFFLLTFISDAAPDTIYLKNGRSMKGLINKETQEGVWLDLGVGAVKFRWEEIDRIEREAVVKKEVEPREVEFSKKGGHIYVNALLNNKVRAKLVLDTGAPNSLLSNRITKELGIETRGLQVKTTAVVGIPDLHIVGTVLDSIKVEGVEARDVDVELSLDENPLFHEDGLLGMSFLKKFKFQIDNVNRKLILEKKKSQNVPERTKYFSVIVPSDWGSWVDEESLRIYGPNLNVKDGPANPSIAIKKITDEQEVGYFETVKKTYDWFKNSPDLRHEMSEGLKKSYEESYSKNKYEPVSFDFEEKKDFIMAHRVFIYKENSTSEKCYKVNVITKGEPLRVYNLSFVCPEQYFDKFLPVFKTCLETFVINE